MARIKSAQAQGQSLQGYVKSVTPSGTFVSLGVLEGFLPSREIRGELRPGMSVQVVVIHIDEERKRIVLSMRHGESTSSACCFW
jgi:ribosomal protein S1